MAPYWIHCRYLILVKRCEFLSFAENMDENIGKSLSINLSDKYSQKKYWLC